MHLDNLAKGARQMVGMSQAELKSGETILFDKLGMKRWIYPAFLLLLFINKWCMKRVFLFSSCILVCPTKDTWKNARKPMGIKEYFSEKGVVPSPKVAHELTSVSGDGGS